MKYDLVIIGAGSAGFAAAIKASELGKKFAIIENGTIGGTCVNVGCVPSKRLLIVSDAIYYLKNRKYIKVKNEGVFLDFIKAVREKDKLVKSLRKSKYVKVLKNLKKGKFFREKGFFISDKEIQVGEKILKADKFLIATGSSPNTIKFEGIDKINYLTNVEALSLKKLPKSMIVIGGRALALEFAQMYSHFGTKVMVLQRSKKILPNAEPEVSKELTNCLRKEGIEINVNVEIKEVDETKGQKIVKCQIKGKELTFEAEQLLFATGRKPNTEGLGLEKAGVETIKSFVKINEYFQTTNPNIYAAGDCVSRIMLETLAAKMGNKTVINAFENKKETINLKEIPSAIFTNPQVASVGYTDKEYNAKKGTTCICRTIPMSLIPKAQIINDIRGLIKMVIDKKTLKIVGLHIVSPLAAEMIHEGTLAVKFGLTINQIIDTVHVFPTLSESIKLVATSFYKDISKLSCCVE